MKNVFGSKPNEYAVYGKPAATKKSDPFNYNNSNHLQTNETSNILAKNEEIKMKFFQDSDKKSKLKQIHRNVESIMNQQNISLNERRTRLKYLLTNENRNYEYELFNMQATPNERALQLKQKADDIKRRKDEANLKFVEEKMDEKWRLECDDLRTFESKKIQASMKAEHLRQMEEKVCERRHKMEEDAIFANLWYEDIKAKKQREEIDAQRAKDKNKETAHILRQQIDVLEEQRQEERRLRNENVKLVEEQINIDKLEKQMDYRKKLENQAARREELDQCVRIKLINEAKRAKEEAAFDLMALEESLASFHNEDEERALRKQQLMKEQKQYRQYLEQQYEEEKRQQQQLDIIINIEIEKQFAKQLARWKAEREARKKLLNQVIKERQQQINDKIERNKSRQGELAREKEQMNRIIEMNKVEEKMERDQLLSKELNYQNDIIQQIDYNSKQKQLVSC
jgi:cilia- and flagella-associated protein 53